MKGKILKKVIAAALVLTLVSGGMPISPVSDMFGGAVITANAANPVFSGEGTEQSPFLIQSRLDWQNFAGYVNTENSTYGDKYYKLTADIEVTGSDSSSLPFIVGGVSSCAFRGHFDGSQAATLHRFRLLSGVCQAVRFAVILTAMGIR